MTYKQWVVGWACSTMHNFTLVQWVEDPFYWNSLFLFPDESFTLKNATKAIALVPGEWLNYTSRSKTKQSNWQSTVSLGNLIWFHRNLGNFIKFSLNGWREDHKCECSKACLLPLSRLVCLNPYRSPDPQGNIYISEPQNQSNLKLFADGH